MRLSWWKIVSLILVFYALIGGFLLDVPRLPILNETIRNLYFHVTMWFGMIIILAVSVVYSVKYLTGFKLRNDIVASEMANVGILFGILGVITGMLWARFTWGAWWVNDPKLNGAAVTLLFYLAYLVLRGSTDEEQKRARLAAVYNIFAFVMLIVFLIIWPRMQGVDSLHPGNGGNPGFSSYDLDSSMRPVFYPAVIGFTLLGIWLVNLKVRLKKATYLITHGENV